MYNGASHNQMYFVKANNTTVQSRKITITDIYIPPVCPLDCSLFGFVQSGLHGQASLGLRKGVYNREVLFSELTTLQVDLLTVYTFPEVVSPT